MQAIAWDPLTLAILVLGFMTLFLVVMYFKRLLWFQQRGMSIDDNWLVSFYRKDMASGGWFHRFGWPVIVLHIAIILSYPVVTSLIVLSPFQFFIYIVMFYIPVQIILLIISSTIIARVNRQPDPKEDEDRYD